MKNINKTLFHVTVNTNLIAKNVIRNKSRIAIGADVSAKIQ